MTEPSCLALAASLLDALDATQAFVVIRPHPRTPPATVARLRALVADHAGRAHLDSEAATDHASLLRAADASVSFGSGSTVESLVLGDLPEAPEL
jgi:hypothetical protein